MSAGTGVVPRPGSTRRRTLWQEIWRQRTAYLFIAPKYALFILFVALPVLWAFLISLQEFRIFDTVWVGLDNFVQVFTSDLFWIALRNTVQYAAVTVPANVLIALVLASLIFPLRSGAQTFFRAAYYLPTVAASVVIAMVWRWIFNYSYGLFNHILQLVGLERVNWLGSSAFAMWSIILMQVLTPPGTGVLLYLAAMGSIPQTLYEAAILDGASPYARWRHITLPLLKPTTLYLVVLATIGSFQVFTPVLIMTQGGPGYSTTTLVHMIFNTAFLDFNFGLAAALSVVLFAIIMVFAIFQFRWLSSDIEYS
ncbi:MAG TPA: sugar ABC transporter permease [Limnochordales bacterium]